MPSGTAPPRITSSARTCASTTPASSPRSLRPASSWPPRPPPLQQPGCPSPSSKPCWQRPGAAAAPTPRPPGSARHSAHPRCASSPQSRKRWDARPWPSCVTSTPPATSADDLEQAVTASSDQHPDAGIITTSFPGLGALTGARVLAEIGDDRSRFHDAKGLKAYAGAAPVTRASGKTIAVLHRRVKNQRLAAGYIWAFAALTASPGARAHYDRRKTAGDRHAAAQRNLFGRLLGCLHQSLATGQHYDEPPAFPNLAPPTRTVAA